MRCARTHSNRRSRRRSLAARKSTPAQCEPSYSVQTVGQEIIELTGRTVELGGGGITFMPAKSLAWSVSLATSAGMETHRETETSISSFSTGQVSTICPLAQLRFADPQLGSQDNQTLRSGSKLGIASAYQVEFLHAHKFTLLHLLGIGDRDQRILAPRLDRHDRNTAGQRALFDARRDLSFGSVVHPGCLKSKPLKFRMSQTPVCDTRSCHAIFFKNTTLVFF